MDWDACHRNAVRRRVASQEEATDVGVTAAAPRPARLYRGLALQAAAADYFNAAAARQRSRTW
jgi:hypothetical protein